MKIIYVTLNNNEEARKIGNELLSLKLANCVNFFPITCIYNYENKITEEPEVVLIIKTKEEKYDEIEKVIKKNINYDNFIGMLSVDRVNGEFEEWLDEVINICKKNNRKLDLREMVKETRKIKSVPEYDDFADDKVVYGL